MLVFAPYSRLFILGYQIHPRAILGQNKSTLRSHRVLFSFYISFNKIFILACAIPHLTGYISHVVYFSKRLFSAAFCLRISSQSISSTSKISFNLLMISAFLMFYLSARIAASPSFVFMLLCILLILSAFRPCTRYAL